MLQCMQDQNIRKTQAQGNITKGKNTKQAQEQENLPRWIISTANTRPICFLSYASGGNSFQKAHTSLGRFCSVVKSIGSWVWFPVKGTYLSYRFDPWPHLGHVREATSWCVCVSISLLSTLKKKRHILAEHTRLAENKSSNSKPKLLQPPTEFKASISQLEQVLTRLKCKTNATGHLCVRQKSGHYCITKYWEFIKLVVLLLWYSSTKTVPAPVSLYIVKKKTVKCPTRTF